MRTQHNIPQFCSFAGHSIKRSGISKSVIRSSFFGFFGLLLVTRLLPAQEAATESLEARLERGKVIYQNLCASCHGELGEGVPGQYENALTGDSTIGQLTELIEKTMPKDEADKCVGADAALVSEYIHHRFYSEAAQIRNRPPRLGLARLTGPQLRQSIADLYGHFQEQVWVSDKTGASAIYFDGDRWKDENKKLERVDPRIQFDFGKSSPVEGLDPKKFYIHWSGAIRPEETGRYEIIVRSTCSFVMDLGRHGRVFIDNHVQSGDKTEFRESIQLTAGRVYPFKIDFIQRERKTEQPPASITLAWVPPKVLKKRFQKGASFLPGSRRLTLSKRRFHRMIEVTVSIAELRSIASGKNRRRLLLSNSRRLPLMSFGRLIERSTRRIPMRTAAWYVGSSRSWRRLLIAVLWTLSRGRS